MLHEWVAFEPGQFGHLDRTVFAYLSQIVSQQVGNHDQFGQFLGTGLKCFKNARFVPLFPAQVK